MAEIDLRLAAYAVKVAQALTTLDDGLQEPEDFYVSKVTFGFDGEDDTSLTVQPDDLGGYTLQAG